MKSITVFVILVMYFRQLVSGAMQGFSDGPALAQRQPGAEEYFLASFPVHTHLECPSSSSATRKSIALGEETITSAVAQLSHGFCDSKCQ